MECIMYLVKVFAHNKLKQEAQMDNQKWWKNVQDKSGFSDEFPPKKIKSLIVTVLIIVVAAFAVLSSVYTVNDKQQAVVTTFGKVTSVEDPGIHFKLPFGIQKAHHVDVNVYRKIEIGYRSTPESHSHAQQNYSALGKTDSVTVDDESKMISGDYNIVNCDFFVEYKISDPVKYLYNSENPDQILKSLAQSHIRNVISSYDVESILTTGKSEIQAKIKEGISEELVVYDLGLVLTDIKLQDSEPPTEKVKEAFKEVETAKQDMETLINNAEAYRNSEIPKAEAEADRLLKDAEYQKQSRINEANMQTAMFNALYEGYAKNPAVTKKRMFFETIEKVLPEAKIYIDTSNSSTQKLLPIESFTQN